MGFVKILMDYGISGASLFLAICLVLKVHKQDIKIKEMEGKMNLTTNNCEESHSQIETNKTKIETVEKNQIKIIGKFETIDTKLENLDNNVGLIRKGLEHITEFFQRKGME